jgi:hypothetical protein
MPDVQNSADRASAGRASDVHISADRASAGRASDVRISAGRASDVHTSTDRASDVRPSADRASDVRTSAVRTPDGRSTDTAVPLSADRVSSTSGRASAVSGRVPATIGRYTVALVPAGRRAPNDLFAPRYAGELGKLVECVLAAEAPVHVDVLARRVGAYFGIGRVDQRVSEHVRVAVDGRGRWGDEDDVVWRLDQDPAEPPQVRVAGADVRRDIREVPLSELAAAARIVVDRAGAIETKELVRDTARLLGFARLTEHVSSRVSAGIAEAARKGFVAVDGGRVVPAMA